MNKKIIIGAALLALGLSLQAAAKAVGGGSINSKPVIVESRGSDGASDSALLAMLGFNSGTVSVGAEYESMKSDSTGFSGYFLFTGKDEKSTFKYFQTISFGAALKAHVYPGQWDLSFAPGFGATMIDAGTAGNTTQKTVFGPTLRLGALYRMGPKTSFGIEQMNIANWFEKEVAYGVTFHYVVLRLDF